MSATRAQAQRWGGHAVAAAFAASLLVGLVLTSRPSQLLDALRGHALWMVAIVVALYWVNGVFKATRWRLLLRAAGAVHGFGATYRAFLVGMAVSNLLPTGLAGEPVRLQRLEGKPTRAGVTATLADRAFDMALLGVCAGAAVPLVAGVDADAVGPVAGLAAALALVGVLLSAIALRGGRLASLAEHPGGLVAAALLTLPIQANDAVRLVLLADVYRIDLGFWRALGIVAAATLAGLLAIVGAGAGLAAGVGALLAASGAPGAESAAVGIVFVATSTWLSLPLGAVAALTGRRERADRREGEVAWT